MRATAPARAAVAAFVCLAVARSAAVDTSEFNDGIDRTDPNFVTASLLVMSPGAELYSCAGHACIRLECPTFNLDYCFSYESESVKDKIFTFFMGRLKMGMFAIPTADYLKKGREEGRGVMQYRLNLPPDAKRRLWKLLDERAAQGTNLPYDYVKRGCGRSVRVVLQEVLHPLQMELSVYPARFKEKTRRELWDDAVVGHPWNRFFLHSFCGTEHDWNVPDIEKIVVPNDLLEFLRIAKVNGAPLVTSAGVELVGRDDLIVPPPVVRFTPFVASLGIFAFASVNFFLRRVWVDWMFLAFLSFAGAFFTYLVFVSNLPATDWNWLIVPFNLLPPVFWKWRRKWALWFALVLVAWEAFMLLSPHRLTDPAYLVLVAAYVVFFLKFTRVNILAARGILDPPPEGRRA